MAYHNGILTDLNTGKKQAEKLSEANGGVQVDLLYKPSHGILCDLIDCVLAKCGFKAPYERMCAHYYTTELQKSPNHEIIAYAHSHGGTRLNNVGKSLSEDQCKKITVETYGSATIIAEGRFKNVNNYVSKMDFVTATSTWRYARNVAGFESNVTFLSPASMNPLTEHFFLGDTYLGQIQRSGDDFKDKYINE